MLISLVYCPPQGLIFNINNKNNPIYASCSSSEDEKPLAIKVMKSIIEASDAVMIAHGDLGVELDPEEVLPIQRCIINKSHKMGRPAIV